MWIRLGQLLLKEGLLSRERLESVLAYQRQCGGRLGSLLLELGLLEESALARVLARQHGIPAVCLGKSRVAPEILALVSETTARVHGVLPIGLEGDVLRVAIANPNDRAAIHSASRDSHRRIKPCVAAGDVLTRAIRRHYACRDRAMGGATPRVIPLSEARSLETTVDDDRVPDLIPRTLFFGHERVCQARLSPDGKCVSTIGVREGRRVIQVAPVHDVSAAKTVADDGDVALRWHTWAPSGRHILYGGDREGDEIQQVYSVDRRTKLSRHLTKVTGWMKLAAAARSREFRSSAKADSHLVGMSNEHPDEVLIQMSPPFGASRVYRIDVASGGRESVTDEPAFGATRYWADENLRLHLFERYENGENAVYARTKRRWRKVLVLPPNSNGGQVLGLDCGRHLLVLDGFRENVAHFVRIDVRTGRSQVVATPRNSDIEKVCFGASGVDAVIEYHPRVTIRALTREFQEHLTYLRTVEKGVPMECDRSSDGRFSLVAYRADDRPPRWYLYDRTRRRARYLFDSEPELARNRFAKMTPLNVAARDGLTLPCYLTLPIWAGGARSGGRPHRPLPTVISVHGGPRWRDYWGFDPEVQWLANRGYAVLNVNYRGSTGFGKRLRDATPGWLAPEMLDDVVDATRWAISEGIADPARVAIMGASYGGYLALRALIQHPDLYACGVDLFGVTDWCREFRGASAGSALGTDDYTARALLEARSPLFQADSLRRPLLVAHGENDVRVSVADSNRLTRKLVAANRPVTYLFYFREGHGFYQGSNLVSYYAVVEQFLAANLGGRLEAFGSDLEGSTLSIEQGAEWVPGLAPFWRATKALEQAFCLGAEELDLSGYGLRELPPSIGELTNLRRLRLARNFLTSLPDLRRLQRLEVLELQANQLRELPEGIGELKKLQILDVCGNQLQQLPDELRGLESLKRLIVGGNLFDDRSLWGFPPRIVRRSRA